MYGKEFCKVYNEFGWNYYPESFGEQLIEWLKLYHFNPRTMLDIGCGTGVLCEIMMDQGLDTVGIDLSEEMINIASKGRGFYETANMITYKPDRFFDLVTCTGDALNHLTSLSDIEEVFKNVYDCLTPGGAFIFDILNGQEGHEEEPFILNYSDTVKAEFKITKGDNNSITLSTSVYENGKFKFKEEIHEVYYSPDSLINLLNKQGFTDITCGDQLLPGESGHGTTWFISGRKPV